MDKETVRDFAPYVIGIILISAIFYSWSKADATKIEEIKTHIETINKLRTIVETHEKTIKSFEEKRNVEEITEFKVDGSKTVIKRDKTVINSKEDTSKESKSLSELSQVQVVDTHSKTITNPNMFFIGIGTTNKLDKDIHIHYKKSNLLYHIYGSGITHFGGSISIGF